MEAGELVLLTTGEYSDFQVRTVCRVIRDFDPDVMMLAYLELYPEQREEYKFDEYRFLKWLIVESAALEELEYFEWHYANYSIFETGGVHKEPKLAFATDDI